MIRKDGHETERAAQREALSLLTRYRYKEGYRSEEIETETNRTLCPDGTIRPYIIKDRETGALTAVNRIRVSKEGDEEFSVIFMAPEEADEANRTYPFRDILEDRIPFILAMRVQFFKPLIPITADEALTAEAKEHLNGFFVPMFDINEMGTEEELDGLTKELAVSDYKNVYPYPETVEKATGETIKSVDDYVRLFPKFLDVELSKEETDIVRSSFLYKAAEQLKEWIVYEFFRTESYSHLRKTAAQAKKLLSPYEEDENVTSVLGSGIDEAVSYAIYKYLGKDANFTRPEHSIADIAEYIEAPVAAVYKANTTIEY